MDFGALQPTSVSKRISSNLDSFTRRREPGDGSTDGISERGFFEDRTLRAGRIYQEVSEQLSFGMENLDPNLLQDLSQYMDDFQQDLRQMVEDIRSKLTGHQEKVEAERTREDDRKKKELKENLDSSFEKMQDFVSSARDRKAPEAERPGEAHLPAGTRSPEERPSALARLSQQLAAEGTPGLARFLGNLDRNPAQKKEFFESLGRELKSPEGSQAFRKTLEDLDQKPGARGTFYKSLAGGLDSKEGRQAFSEVLKAVHQSPGEQARLFKALADSAATPAGRANLAAFLREPEAGRSLLPNLASATATPEGREQAGKLFSSLRRDPEASAAFLGVLRDAPSTEEGRTGFQALLRNLAQDPEGSKGFLGTLASASRTPEGRAGSAHLLQAASADAATAKALLGAYGQALQTPEGREALGAHFEGVGPEAGQGFLQLARAATLDAQGQGDFDQLLQDLARTPTTAAALKKQVAEALRTPEGAQAFLALAGNLLGEGEKQGHLLSFLLPTTGSKAQAPGSPPPHEASEDWEGLGALFGEASRSEPGAQGLLGLLGGAVLAESGREAAAALLAGLRGRAQARNDFLLALALGAGSDRGAESLQRWALEMNRTPEARDSVVRTLAQAATSDSGRGALLSLVGTLSQKPSARDAVLGLLDSAAASDGQRRSVELLVKSAEKSHALQDSLRDMVGQAASTPKGQVEFKNLVALLGLPLPDLGVRVPPRPGLAAPRSPGITPADLASEAPGTSKAYTERAQTFGSFWEAQRARTSGRRQRSDRVEEVKLEGHKRTAFEASDLFPASAFVSFRRCSHCGLESKAPLETCPNCSGEGRQTVMSTRVRYNRNGAFFSPLEDLVEFTPRAFALLAESLLGPDRVASLRFQQVTPRFKELLEVVRIYR